MSGSAALGVGLAYLFDFQNGRRRRARLRDRGFRFLRKAGEALRSRASDLGGRILGLAQKVRHILKEETVDDQVLMERVRSKLGHHVSHAHSLKVEARDGVVTLRGPIATDEIAGLLNHVRRIPGVQALVPLLDPKRGEGLKSQPDSKSPGSDSRNALRPPDLPTRAR